ncbi:MAG: hypothetical protein NXI28_02315 [bacterium]|nr:hypothetical protein [bacterium]
MDQVKLPTDSLYKFIAIFGLAALIGSQVATYAYLDDYWERGTAFFENVSDPDGSKYEAIRRFSTERKGIDEYIRTLPPNERAAFVGLLRRQEDNELIKGDITFARRSGLAMIFIGFTLWYLKVQVHVDKILRCEANDIICNK